MTRIDDLRRMLLDRQHTLLHQVARAEDDIRWLDTNVLPELEEEAQEENLSRLLGRLDARGRNEIAAIDEALARIERGDYGACDECGEEIPIARLEALPSATLCVTCAELRERREHATSAT